MDTYNTVTLLGVITQIRQFDPFLLQMFFPNMVEFATREIAIDKVAKSLKLAPFVSPMMAGKARTSEGHSTTSFIPAYLKPKEVVDPARLLKRMAGEGIGGTVSPGDRRDMIVADILSENDAMILNRLEWMAAQALLTGKVTVEGDDYPAVEVDFQRKASLTKSLTGGARWGESGVSVVDDLESWADEAESPIDKVVMEGKAWALARKDASVKDLLDTRRGSRSEMEIGPDSGRNYSFKGTLGSDLEVWVYGGKYDDDLGVTKKFLPDYSVILGSGAVEGTRAFGAIMSPGAGYQPMQSYPRHFVTQDPELEFVETQSAPLIIPGRPDATVAITVHDGA